MVLGFLGLPNSGKTTVFNAMTGFEAEVGYLHRAGINKAYLEVFDERILKLKKMYNPLKTSFCGIEVYDFAKSEDDKDNEYFNSVEAKLMDAIAIVLRCFDDEVIDVECGSPDPLRDLSVIESEFIIADMIIAEKRLEKVKLNLQRGVKGNNAPSEEKVLEKILSALHKELPIRMLELNGEEEKMIKSFQFLTNKPLSIIINTDEAHLEESLAVKTHLNKSGYKALEVVGKYEMELLSLDENDAKIFLQEIGQDSLAKERIIKSAYEALNCINFFTVGQQEVRSWTINRGQYAPEAAGKIHSDMQKGFIRAECFHYNDLMEFGSEKAVKDKGRFRLEGKTYQVKDGDILIIRFSK